MFFFYFVRRGWLSFCQDVWKLRKSPPILAEEFILLKMIVQCTIILMEFIDVAITENLEAMMDDSGGGDHVEFSNDRFTEL